MSTQPLGTPKFRWSDSNGSPLSGGLLYTYAAGTTTPLSTYTTRAGSVANANPVVLDSRGEADVWLTPGVDYKFVLKNSAGVTQWTVDNYPSPSEQSATTADASTNPGGRLTLTTGTPVTTSDVTGATTVYYTQHRHAKVPLYDGAAWTLWSIGTELSQATTDNTKSPAAVANNSNYDVFIWNDSGTIRSTRGPAWTSDTARGAGAGTSELQQVDGRWVNKNSITNGPAAQRGLYVGTIRSDGSAQVNDSLSKRHVWNCYNRAFRPMGVYPGTSWTYSTATIRQANASSANQLDFVVGLQEDAVNARVHTDFQHTGAGNIGVVGIGLDSTTAFATGCVRTEARDESTAAGYAVSASWVGYTGLGRHYLAWLEKASSGAATYTWNFSGVDNSGGISGQVMA